MQNIKSPQNHDTYWLLRSAWTGERRSCVLKGRIYGLLKCNFKLGESSDALGHLERPARVVCLEVIPSDINEALAKGETKTADL